MSSHPAPSSARVWYRHKLNTDRSHFSLYFVSSYIYVLYHSICAHPQLDPYLVLSGSISLEPPISSRNPKPNVTPPNALVLRNIDKVKSSMESRTLPGAYDVMAGQSASRHRNGFATFLAFSEVIVVLSKFSEY